MNGLLDLFLASQKYNLKRNPYLAKFDQSFVIISSISLSFELNLYCQMMPVSNR